MEYSYPSVCVYVSVCKTKTNNGSVHLKLEHINCSIWKQLGRVRHWALSDQGEGHEVTLNFFSIYHNTNCQVLNVSFSTY